MLIIYKAYGLKGDEFMERENEEVMHIRLLHAFHRIRRANISVMMEVSQSEFFALQIIYKYQQEYPDKEGIYVSELAEKLRIASSQTSRMLRNLEKRKLIKRSVDAKDRRNTYVVLTDEGENVWRHTKKCLMAYVKRVQNGMGEEKIEQLIGLCNEMAQIMEHEIKKTDRDALDRKE